MRSRSALGFNGASVDKTGFSSGAILSFVLECAMPDLLQVVTIRGENVHDQLSADAAERRTVFVYRPGQAVAISHTVQNFRGI